MFNKSLYNRSAYDKSVSSTDSNIVGNFYGMSSVNIATRMLTNLYFDKIAGSGRFDSGIIAKSAWDTQIQGEGKVNDLTIIMGLSLSSNISGSGALTAQASFRTPLSSTISGIGAFNFTSSPIRQVMIFSTVGRAELAASFMLSGYVPAMKSDGAGSLTSILLIKANLSIGIQGAGNLELRHMSEFNQSIFELDGINLAPGQEVTIDTDDLSVYFGYIQDVSSVTTDSVFFELSPGDNVISIESDTGQQLNITAIWQNRWL